MLFVPRDEFGNTRRVAENDNLRVVGSLQRSSEVSDARVLQTHHQLAENGVSVTESVHFI